MPSSSPFYCCVFFLFQFLYLFHHWHLARLSKYNLIYSIFFCSRYVHWAAQPIPYTTHTITLNVPYCDVFCWWKTTKLQLLVHIDKASTTINKSGKLECFSCVYFCNNKKNTSVLVGRKCWLNFVGISTKLCFSPKNESLGKNINIGKMTHRDERESPEIRQSNMEEKINEELIFWLFFS